MSSETERKAKDRFQKMGSRLDEGAQKLEQESERAIAYINNEVVPAIRNHSSKALRVAAEQLRKLAEYMEQHRSS